MSYCQTATSSYCVNGLLCKGKVVILRFCISAPCIKMEGHSKPVIDNQMWLQTKLIDIRALQLTQTGSHRRPACYKKSCYKQNLANNKSGLTVCASSCVVKCRTPLPLASPSATQQALGGRALSGLKCTIYPAHGIKGYRSSAAAVQGQFPLTIDLSRSAGLVVALARVGVPKAVGILT